MVLLTLCRCGSGSAKRTFIDNVRVYARGGGGGQGLPRYGGVGGRGGSVYVMGEERATLKNLAKDPNKRRCIGESGQNSKPMMLQGAPGKDVELLVPPGVEVVNDAGRVLGEVNEVGDRVLVARGGAGGGPANNFLGQRAGPINLRLNLKLIADVGLVGFPNAGKSTLLSAISRAAPKIASYAFTTIQPQIGTIGYEDGRQVSVADLPGLIEGAHLNVGMGHKFLKHVERTKLLLFVVDLHGFRLDLKHHPRSAIETVLLLNKELELYKPELLSKPCVLVLNKVDLEHSDTELLDTLHHVTHLSTTTRHNLPRHLLPTHFVNFDHVLPISAKDCVATDELTDKIRSLLDLYTDRERAREETERGLQVSDGRHNKLVTPGERGRLLV